MKKLAIGILTFIFVNCSFSNDLINHIESAVHGQTYCIKGDESKEISEFLKKHAEYAYNECKHNKTTKEDFDKLVKLAEKDPKKYGFYLGMAYYVGWTDKHEMNDAKAKEWFSKSSKLGNSEAQIKYCNLTTQTKKQRIECYNSLDSAKSYLARAYYIYINDIKNKYKYIEKASNNGSLEAYPLYISDEMSLHENYVLNKSIKVKLESVINNNQTSLSAKYASAGILDDDRVLDIIAHIKKES